MLLRITKPLLDIIAPHTCAGCDVEGALVCEMCISVIEWQESKCYICSTATVDYQTCVSCNRSSNIKKAMILAGYDDPIIKDLVYQMKFNNNQEVAEFFGKQLAQMFGGHLKDCVVTHLPTATTRIRSRGYDQSALIARKLAKTLGLEYRDTLVRLDQSRQLGRTKDDRNRGNLQYRGIRNVKGEIIVLVDDVITTGFSMKKASLELSRHGAKEIIGLAVARV